METFKKSFFKKITKNYDFLQDNHSKSQKGVFRGLHYQLNPNSQGKLVRTIRGSLIDIIVDIRIGSPTYRKWKTFLLSEKNKHILWVPPGFAHGVYILENDTELLYKTTSEYSPKDERGINWNDPNIGIKLPIDNPILSDKDKKLPLLKDAENNFFYKKEKEKMEVVQ